MPTSWTFDPATLAFLAALLGGYYALMGPLRRRYALGAPVSFKRQVWFVAGWATLAVSVVSPLDVLGREYLFAAHTLQLLIITTVSAPLLMLAIPEWVFWHLLPLRALRDATRGVLFPVFAVIGFNGLVLFWQVGTFYDAAQRSMPTHDLQNLSFFIAGLLTWWPLLTPLDAHTRMSHPLQMLYLVVESLPLDIFGVAALFIPRVFYPLYLSAPRLFGLSAQVDQQVAGAMLAVPGNIVDIVLMSIIFFKWVERTERIQRERERADAERELAELQARGVAGKMAEP